MSAEEKLYDQKQVDSLVSAAVEKAVGEAKADLDKELVTVRTELEQATESIETKDGEIETLKTNITDRDEAKRLDALGDDRVASVKEIASFSDDELSERKERWAAMSDEEFASTLEDFKAIVETASKSSDDDDKKTKTPDTKFDGTRETASNKDKVAPVKSFLGSLN